MGDTTDTMAYADDSMSFHVTAMREMRVEMKELINAMEDAGKEMRERTDAISYSFDEMAETGEEMREPVEETVKMDGF